MKTIKLIIALAFLSIGIMSCNQDQTDPVQEQDQSTLETSEAAKTVTNILNNKVAVNDGTAIDLEQRLATDFGFKFVYPITLAYNNGTEITVTNNQQLLNVAADITSSLFIDKIGFPFDLEKSSGIETISNENDFFSTINTYDIDGDGTPNYQDTDDDGDGIADTNEDINGDGMETNDDTDGDNTPDFQDTDDDGDGVDTADEDIDGDGDPTNDDTDGDGIPNCQDTDDDGDGVDTADEDNDHDGNTSNDDSDGDGTPDYLDTDSDNDGVDDGEDSDADGDGTDDDQEGNDDDNDGNDDDDDGNDDDGNDDDNDGGGN